MKNLRCLRDGVTCLMLFLMVVSCQNDLETPVRPKKDASARVSSTNDAVESELLYLEGQFGIAFTSQEVRAIESQPDPMGILNRIHAALSQFGNQVTTQLEETFRQIEQPFRSITQGERTILSNTVYGYRIALFLYVLDAVDATAFSGSTCGDCRQNAFKHAYFRIANGWSFNRTVSRQLGDAHEANQNGIATQMDLHNNDQGLIVFDMVNRFSEAQAVNGINARMDSGFLRYVRNGVLTPTNQ